MEEHSTMSPLQAVYSQIYNTFGGNEALLSCVVSYLVVNGTFWILSGLLLYVDVYQSPKWIAKFKVQQEFYAGKDWPKLKKALKLGFTYITIINGLMTYPIYLQQKMLGVSFAVEEVPAWTKVIFDLAACVVIQEIIFYYSHRLLHHPVFYKRIHKVHHQWTAPIGLTSVYAHPAEFLISNGISVLAGPLLMRSHITVFFLWYSLLLMITITHHSGYHLPLLPSPEFHDYHHLKFNSNYGTWGWLDRLHGTDGMFQKSVQVKRHHILLSTTPMSQTVPDDYRDKEKKG